MGVLQRNSGAEAPQRFNVGLVERQSIRFKPGPVPMPKVGDLETGMKQIEHLLSIPSWLSVSILKLDPHFDPLRQHPRFQKLLEQPDKVF